MFKLCNSLSTATPIKHVSRSALSAHQFVSGALSAVLQVDQYILFRAWSHYITSPVPAHVAVFVKISVPFVTLSGGTNLK